MKSFKLHFYKVFSCQGLSIGSCSKYCYVHVLTFHACNPLPPPPPHPHPPLSVSFVFLALVRGRTQHLRVVSHKLLCRCRCHHRSCVLDMFICSEVRKWVRSRRMQAKTPILLALFATCPAKHIRNVSQIIDKKLSKPSRED